jgi:hypothetical protein
LVGSRKRILFYKEPSMAAQPRDPEAQDSEVEKKKAETVQLSAEELRKISGGASSGAGTGGNNPPGPKDLHRLP